MLLPLLAGCHGSRGLREFAVPEEFDTNRDYEITFWAKNDTNKTQTQIYQKSSMAFWYIWGTVLAYQNSRCSSTKFKVKK